MPQFEEYPKTMRHPQNAPAVVGERSVDKYGKVNYGIGSPERFPDIHVPNADQEEEARARGYLAYGETPPIPEDFTEYPVCLIHPDHVDAILPETHESREPDGKITRWMTPGVPEKYPHQFANDEEEESGWIAKGYKRPGTINPFAKSDEEASPYVPGHVVSEYPKWVDGKVIQDPRLVINGISQYPKWIASLERAVDSPEEEATLLGHTME